MYSICWLRRDLRLHDQAALYHALRSGNPVIPVFLFDSDILSLLEDKNDARVDFIYQTVQRLDNQLHEMGSALFVFHGKPADVFRSIAQTWEISDVYLNHDYEPAAMQRDAEVSALLREKGIGFHTCKDQCIFEKSEILSQSQTPYSVFTPYARKWKETCTPFYTKAYPTEKYFSRLIKKDDLSNLPVFPRLEQIGFTPSGQTFPSPETDDTLIRKYREQRDFPAISGTSRLSVHLRFGTISIRQLARKSEKLSETFTNELIWRDFYMMILHHYPHVVKKAFRPEYDFIPWRNQESEFDAWRRGETGYPLVDAGMRELAATGFMHNRVRMVTASFLVKHLLIDWRWGESWFARKLLDFDLSANNGGWQWAAGSGCDAAPYFRVFNPTEQTRKFDPRFAYIRKWVPEFESLTYAKPLVEHTFARNRALETYKTALAKARSGTDG